MVVSSPSRSDRLPAENAEINSNLRELCGEFSYSHQARAGCLCMDAAIEEITKNNGILYDPEVVDDCVTLLFFRRLAG